MGASLTGCPAVKAQADPSTQAVQPTAGLRRELGAFDLVLLGVGAIIGVGIFVLTGQTAAVYAGPAVVLSFAFAGVACAAAALCYSEMASLYPVAGSAYSYARASMGELVAWIIGWDLILEYSVASATVAVGWSGYVVGLLGQMGVRFPARLATAPYDFVPGRGWVTTGSIVNAPAVLVAAVTTIILVLGIRGSANVNRVLVAVKVGVIVIFIVAGLGAIHSANWHPFIPANTGEFGHFGWSGIFRGAAVVFVAYIGFDAVSTVAQETSHPQKSVPIGILGSLVICTLLYALVAAVLTGIVPYRMLNTAEPIALGIDAARLFWISPLIRIGAIAGLSSVILVMILGQTRILWAMAIDGLLPRWCGRLHPRYQTPYLNAVAAGIFVSLSGGLLPIRILAEMVSIGTLLAFAMVCAGVWILRHSRPNVERPFRIPAGPAVCLAGVLSCLYLMVSLPWETWARLLVWMALGLIIYGTYSRRNRARNRANQLRSLSAPPASSAVGGPR
jgi:APA family basic amino acid/polyamine antiporter